MANFTTLPRSRVKVAGPSPVRDGGPTTVFTTVDRAEVSAVGPSVILGDRYLSIGSDNFLNIGAGFKLIINPGRDDTPWTNLVKT